MRFGELRFFFKNSALTTAEPVLPAPLEEWVDSGDYVVLTEFHVEEHCLVARNVEGKVPF